MNTSNNKTLFETTYWKIVLLEDQRYLGRCVVALKRPCQNLSDLNASEVEDWHQVVKKLELVFGKTFGAAYFNWSCLMNTNPDTRQVHWHFRPRYYKPLKVGKRTFTDPNPGQHALIGVGDELLATEDELNSIIEMYNEAARQS